MKTLFKSWKIKHSPCSVYADLHRKDLPSCFLCVKCLQSMIAGTLNYWCEKNLNVSGLVSVFKFWRSPEHLWWWSSALYTNDYFHKLLLCCPLQLLNFSKQEIFTLSSLSFVFLIPLVCFLLPSTEGLQGGVPKHADDVLWTLGNGVFCIQDHISVCCQN